MKLSGKSTALPCQKRLAYANLFLIVIQSIAAIGAAIPRGGISPFRTPGTRSSFFSFRCFGSGTRGRRWVGRWMRSVWRFSGKGIAAMRADLRSLQHLVVAAGGRRCIPPLPPAQRATPPSPILALAAACGRRPGDARNRGRSRARQGSFCRTSRIWAPAWAAGAYRRLRFPRVRSRLFHAGVPPPARPAQSGRRGNNRSADRWRETAASFCRSGGQMSFGSSCRAGGAGSGAAAGSCQSSYSSAGSSV